MLLGDHTLERGKNMAQVSELPILVQPSHELQGSLPAPR